jgi:surface protein
MANLITIKDTGEYPQVYTINGDSIKAIKTYASESNVGYYTCKLYTNTTDTYVFEFQSLNPSALEDNITKAILSNPGNGLISVDTSGIYFYPDAIPIPVSNTLKYTVIAEENSGEYALPFVWQEMIDDIYNDDELDPRTSTAVVNYDCTVDWGDGSPIETFTTEDVTDFIIHDYSDSETEFTITITGTFEGWSPGLFYEYDDGYYDTGRDIKKILDWGSLKILGPYWFTEMYNAEPLANNQPILKLADIPCYLYYDNVNDEIVSGYGKSLAYTFDSAENLLSNGEGSYNPIDISSWDLTGVISLRRMFVNYGSPLDVDITQWNTSDVLSMGSMFSDFLLFDQDISGWDISNVVSIESMFEYTEFNQDISAWDVSNVKDMSALFYSNATFNQDISNWDVSNVTNMAQTFNRATSFNQDISGWNVSNVTNMWSMFQEAVAFNQPIGVWNVSSVTDISSMFSGGVSGVMTFDQDISPWNVSNVTNMRYVFRTNTTFNQPLNSWSLSNVTNMQSMFDGASSFNQDISAWNTSSVTDMRYLFRNAILFNRDLSPWNVANVTTYTNFDLNTPAWVLPKPSF